MVAKNGATTNTYYVFADQIDTPRALANASGQIVWRWEGEGFGSSAPNEDPDNNSQLITYNLRFPGQLHDKESALHYNHHRYYDLTTGRYISSDPIGLEGGINTYAYVQGNPLSKTDPLGLASEPAATGGGASQSGLFPGPSACTYYEKKCNESCGEDKYACEAKKCCESFGNNFFSNCTRKCLIDQDMGACGDLKGAARDSCRKRAHYFCYSACFNVPDAVAGGFGTLPPPACMGAAGAIGGMW